MTDKPAYYKFSDYLIKRFGEKVWKVPVEAGFTCPNRDGHKGVGGCIYCSVDSFDGAEQGSIADQVLTRITKLKKNVTLTNISSISSRIQILTVSWKPSRIESKPRWWMTG